MRARLGCAKLVWSSLTSLGFSRGRPSKADPIFRGSKLERLGNLDACDLLPKQTRSSGGQNEPIWKPTRAQRSFQSRPDLQGVKTASWGLTRPSTSLPKQTRSSGGQNPPGLLHLDSIQTSKADPIFRGSKLIEAAYVTDAAAFQSRPDLQGVKTRISRMRFSSQSAFQSRPDLQGVKTPSGCCPADQTSKADPIFRGSKQVGERLEHVGGFFQSRPDLQGVKTERVGNPVLIEAGTSKADPIFRGSKLTVAGLYPGEDAFQSRPDLQGVKTRHPHQPANRDNLPKQTRSSGGQNQRQPNASLRIGSSKADPIFRGSKPPSAPLPATTTSSKADPIFRGSKQ